MKLSLKNIGKIGAASVEINGITVIAGENNTGKSTVGRALFSIFNSFYNIEKQINAERTQSIENLVELMYRNTTNRLTRRFDTEEIAQNIIAQIDLLKENSTAIKEEIIKSVLQYDEHFEKYVKDSYIDEIVSRIKDNLNVSDVDIFKSVLEKKLYTEFNGQVSNIFSNENGKIELRIKDQSMVIDVVDNNVVEVHNKIDLHTEAIYLDDPFVLDESRLVYYRPGLGYADHRNHLKAKLYFENKDTNLIEEIVASNKFENIYKKISSVCGGEIVRNKQSRFSYRTVNTEKTIDVRNLSTGLKTFVILKILLLNGTLDYNGTIVLDEPEIHLHPEWQMLFAELIVLIQKEFGMHILLNTHSPYFLRALQVYSAQHGVVDKCKYYLSEVRNEQAYISDVTDNIEKIYSKLARPLQQLENSRWQND